MGKTFEEIVRAKNKGNDTFEYPIFSVYVNNVTQPKMMNGKSEVVGNFTELYKTENGAYKERDFDLSTFVGKWVAVKELLTIDGDIPCIEISDEKNDYHIIPLVQLEITETRFEKNKKLLGISIFACVSVFGLVGFGVYKLIKNK